MSFSKIFTPDTIGPGSTTTLSFSIVNPDPVNLTNLAFTDTLPAGVFIATPANATATCDSVLIAPDGGTTISFSADRMEQYSACAIAVDVTTTGDTPEATPMAVELGKGPAVKVQDSGMIAHPMVRDLLIEHASKAKIPYQLEVLARGTTDAAAIQLARAGVPAGCVSIACRYYHTPSEMVDMGDVENSVKLLLAVLGKPIEI